MKIGVLVKTVAYVHAQTGSDIKKNWVSDDDIVRMVNPLDEVALEWALRLKDRRPDTTVVAISLGDRFCEEGLRKSLAMGADEALHLKSDEVEKLDAAARSQLLARACSREKFDLILCGAGAIDDNESLHGPYLAGRLGIPHVTCVVEVDASGGSRLILERVVERGDRQRLECSLPALLTVEKGNLVPRYPTLAGCLRAEKSVLKTESAGKGDGQFCNVTEVIGYTGPKPKKRRPASQTLLSAAERLELMVNRDASRQKEGGMVVEGGSQEMVKRLARILQDVGIVKK